MEFYDTKIVSVEDLIPYALNSRTHSDEQVAQLAASIREFGFTNPVLVDEANNLIAGHGRLLAARKLKLEQVPAVVVTGLDDRKRRALVIADNKLALNAGWDEEALRVELEDLAGDFGELMGFSEKELESLLSGNAEEDGLTDPDAVPDLQEESVTVLGDTWLLGKHRLHCGDSTLQSDVDHLMNDGLADLVWTDPPYNVNYEGGTGMKIQNDSMDNDAFRQFLRDAFTTAFTVTKAGRPIYIAHADSEGYNFRGAMVESGWNLKQCIIWVKNSLVLGRQDYQWMHEPVLYGWKPGEAHKWYGDFNKTTVIDDDVNVKDMSKKELVSLVNELRNAKPTTVVREAKPHRNDIHPTMKPVALVNRFVRNSSRTDDIVLDLFGGGGSTLIACEQLGRHARLMELDPKYCDVIIKRWQDFTGEKAVHAESGKTYEELSA